MKKEIKRWIPWLILIIIVLILVFWVIGTYNSLVTKRENVDKQWAQVQSQYQRRVDLIPNLVETVKGYASHERELFEQITRLRSQWSTAKTINEQVETANQIEQAIGRLLLVVENYPDLKASQNFLALQDELAGTENRIAVERMRYNQDVRNYMVKKKMFPSNIIASIFNFEDRNYFEAKPGSEEPPKVQF